MDNSLFPPKWKDVVFDKDDLLPVYIYRKGAWEDLCYFDKELPNKDDNNDEKIKNNKIDKENKKNISDNKPLRASASNKDIQTLPTQEEEEYSWTSDSDKCQIAIMNHI